MTKTACDRCKGNLDRGEVTFYKNGIECETICFLCDKEEHFAFYAKNKKITTKLMLDSMLAVRDLKDNYLLQLGDFDNLQSIIEISNNVDKLKVKCKVFESAVWFDGLQNEVVRSKFKGMSASTVKVKVLTYAMCGRCMITFYPADDNDNDHITLITDETSTESCMGIQGINCNFEKAVSLIDSAITEWKAGKLKFETDTKVNMGI